MQPSNESASTETQLSAESIRKLRKAVERNGRAIEAIGDGFTSLHEKVDELTELVVDLFEYIRIRESGDIVLGSGFDSAFEAEYEKYAHKPDDDGEPQDVVVFTGWNASGENLSDLVAQSPERLQSLLDRDGDDE